MPHVPGGGLSQYGEFHAHNNGAEITISETESMKDYRTNLEVAEAPPTTAEYFPRQWLWNGPPYALNPVRLNQWIQDGSTAGERSETRGVSYDRQAVEDLLKP